MFGNADWFHLTTGRMLIPRSAAGIGYYAIAALVILLPAAVLLSLRLTAELLIWLFISAAFVGWEYFGLVKRVQNRYRLQQLSISPSSKAEVFQTDHYELYLKDNTKTSVAN